MHPSVAVKTYLNSSLLTSGGRISRKDFDFAGGLRDGQHIAFEYIGGWYNESYLSNWSAMTAKLPRDWLA